MAQRYMNWFRKNQKVMLAFLGVVCIITFTIGGSLDLFFNWQQPARMASGEDDDVVLTWSKGKVRASELFNLRVRHNVATNFLANVIRETVDRGGTPIVNGQQIQKGRPIQDVGIPLNDSDEALVETMLLAQESRRMGIAVDQAAVEDFLRQISAPELAEGDWLEIAKNTMGESAHLTVKQLFEHLAYELRAHHVRVLANAGLLAIPPGELWGYFNRLNRRVSIEAFPVEVAAFVEKVPGEPTQAELQKLFDEGKFREPNPMLAEPGFRKPHRAAFSFVRVDFTPFLEAAKKQITEEQIAAQYQKDISQGLHKARELPKETPPTDKKDDEKKDAEKPADSKPEEGKAPADSPAQPKAGEAKADAPEDGCQAAPPANEEKPAEKPAEKAAEPGATETKPGETRPADAKPAEEPKFKPLVEVHDDILKQLAQPIAQEARTKAVKEVTDAINEFGRRYRRYQTVKEIKKDKAEAPPKLDLEALAAKHGFIVGSTPLIDQHESQNYEIGKNVMSFDMAAAQRGNFRMQSFADIAFVEDEPLYTAREVSATLPDVSYIYFRTAEEKGGDVKLEDVKKDVIAAWKKQRAFELAQAEAQKLAAKAQSAKSLAEAVGDAMKVVTPPAFSWMTTGAMAMGFSEPELSQVPGVELPGQDFMEAVFKLKIDETGTAPNQSHDKVYVVRVLAQDPSDELLRTQFLETGLNFQVVGIGRRDIMQTTYDWFREIEKQYQVTWVRPPRPGSRGF